MKVHRMVLRVATVIIPRDVMMVMGTHPKARGKVFPFRVPLFMRLSGQMKYGLEPGCGIAHLDGADRAYDQKREQF